MSNISNRHSVVPFVSGETKALSNQRLAKVGYKATKNQPNPPKSIAVSVPYIEEINETQMDMLMPHLRGLLENAQDGIIRSLYEGRNFALDTVSDDEISVDSCIQYLTAEAAGARIKMSDVESWFDIAMAESIAAALCVKLGLESAEDARIVKMLGVYRELLAGLCGKMVRYTPKQIAALDNVMALGEPHDKIGRYLIGKLEEQKKPRSIADELADAL
jgi:hypothetical protein